MSWITRTITAGLWALWRCFPSSVRLAVYHWIKKRYGVAGYGPRIRMLPFGLVCKEGMLLSHHEAENVRFVAKNTSIPVPRILDVIDYTSAEDSIPAGLIIMTRLEGQCLSDWIAEHAIPPPGGVELIQRMDACLDNDDFAGFNAVVAQIKALPPSGIDLSDAGPLIQDLRDAFRELRALPSPASPAVSALSGRRLFLIRTGDSELVGPFQDQQEFKDYIFAQANPILFAHRMPTLRRLAEPVNAKRHRTCFTHADLAARNILVKDGRLSGIVDWEFSGWYPEYWELVSMEMQMLHEGVAHKFWDAVQLFGPEPYRDELALEWALWCCTGMSSVVGEEGDDLSCPRIKHTPSQVTEGDVGSS